MDSKHNDILHFTVKLLCVFKQNIVSVIHFSAGVLSLALKIQSVVAFCDSMGLDHGRTVLTKDGED